MKKVLLSLFISFPLIAFATFEDGVDAFNRGDYSRAAREWQPLANSGDSDAARNLARLYQQGLGVKTDLFKARQLYRLAAAKCNATAQNNLGLMMLNGHGGEKDLVGAFRLFEKAAMQGLHADADAMGNLAGMYFTGAGTQTNVIEAYKWYVLYGEYTTDVKNKQQLLSLLPQVEKSLTSTQKAEAIKRANSFQKTRCVP
jgi:TPR repeat protein